MDRLSLCDNGSIFCHIDNKYIKSVESSEHGHSKILEDRIVVEYEGLLYYLLMDFTQLKYNFYMCTRKDNTFITGLVLDDHGDTVYEVCSLDSLSEVIKSDKLRASLLKPNPNPVEALLVFLREMGEL